MRETPRADVAPGTVLAEWTRGYRLGGKLVRAAKVEVARAADEDDAAADGS
jgi:molecular chaperone GrpE (heat shock protein)